MAPPLRTFWLLSCPLVWASAVLHVPLERAIGVEIEHNMKFDGQHCRVQPGTLELATLAKCVASQSSARIVSGYGTLDDCPGSRVGCSGVREDPSARCVAFLLTIRLLV